MTNEEIVGLLVHHGVKPTPNRILIAQALAAATRPSSQPELERRVETLDKSSIFRTLGTFRVHGLVHVIEDGSDTVKYELCLSHDADHDDDQHVHFYCERCNRTYCLESIHIPQVTLPAGYEVHGVNYVIKGLCPHCARQASME